ncbi:DUF3429 domain-containing protein [Aliidiomarina minuta]|uniref:DUF3429 domain-containing protein n=1 Tax=Aliidiomarina minuta TaxID=880057 RepID=A0A432W8B1_9GAMM|nr:DUF3429 domain-containing protein [Aliidiomarina minuta]RUO26305.1 DUF3429 domain-containing protein [Aliidiomarina minuta]
MQQTSIQSAVRLTWLGLIPFIVTTVLGAVNLWQITALQAFLVYSATILSFLGGIHFGLVMGDRLERPSGRLLLCMLPAIVGWLSVAFLPALPALVVLALFYLLWLKYDLTAVSEDWYQKMRKPVTFVVTGCHFLWIITVASERVLVHVT